MSAILLEKCKLRSTIALKLGQISNVELDIKSEELSLNLGFLFSLLAIIPNKNLIGAFAPIQKEPIWYKSFDASGLEALSFPSVLKNEQMVFRKSKLSELIVQKDFGVSIKGPSKRDKIVSPDLLLIPGLAFSLDGSRLGRGKGYYDSYLQKFNGLRIGIGFECQIVDKIPTERHDEFCHWIVTEKDIYHCKR